MFDEFQFQEYLGDGVYASFDGWQIWLAVNDHRNRVVALEPTVMRALEKYTKRIETLAKELSHE